MYEHNSNYCGDHAYYVGGVVAVLPRYTKHDSGTRTFTIPTGSVIAVRANRCVCGGITGDLESLYTNTVGVVDDSATTDSIAH